MPFWLTCPIHSTWSGLRLWWSPALWTLWPQPLLQQKHLPRRKQRAIRATIVSLSQAHPGHLQRHSRITVSRPFRLPSRQAVHLKTIRSVVMLLENVCMTKIHRVLFLNMTAVIPRRNKNSEWIFFSFFFRRYPAPPFFYFIYISADRYSFILVWLDFYCSSLEDSYDTGTLF